MNPVLVGYQEVESISNSIYSEKDDLRVINRLSHDPSPATYIPCVLETMPMIKLSHKSYE